MAPNLDVWLTRHLSSVDGMTANEYGGWSAYGLSKISNILFAREFDRRYSSLGVSAVSLHPGAIATDLQRHSGILGGLLRTIGRPFSKTIPQGAATTVCVCMCLYCALVHVLFGDFF